MPPLNPRPVEPEPGNAKGIPAHEPRPRGFTTREVARRYRVSEDKVRAWIQRRELVAVNTSDTLCARPRWVVTAEALADFERRRAGGSPPEPRRRRRPAARDYYPD